MYILTQKLPFFCARKDNSSETLRQGHHVQQPMSSVSWPIKFLESPALPLTFSVCVYTAKASIDVEKNIECLLKVLQIEKYSYH